MNRNRSTAGIATWALGMAVATAPADLDAQSPGRAAANQWQGNPSAPYSRLFDPRDVGAADDGEEPPTSAAPASADGRRVVCGMTLIPANPNVDPGMLVDRRDDSTRFTIRAVEPRECWLPTPR